MRQDARYGIIRGVSQKRKRSDGMTRVSVAIVAAAGAMLGAAAAFADEEKVGD